MKVLVAPLDWGLGHATRCVPIIRSFLDIGAEVSLGVCGNISSFYKDVFPELKQFRIPSYRIVYPKHGYQMPAWILTELPRILKVVAVEHAVAESLVRRENIDLIVSDNRFGFYSETAKSIYMTHQMRIAFPGMTRIFETVGVKFHQRQMAHFSEVWVPDVPEFPGLAGRLSHLDKKNETGDFFANRLLRYVGPLSRFSSQNVETLPKKFKFLGVVSGAEPMRTRLERRLRQVFKEIPGEHAIILGRPELTEVKKEGNITLFPHLSIKPFAEVVAESECFISRPGYSTVMDQAVLGANCIFVPTPGQTEQVYLGKILDKSNFAHKLDEHELTAKKLLEIFESEQRKLPNLGQHNLLQEAILAQFKKG